RADRAFTSDVDERLVRPANERARVASGILSHRTSIPFSVHAGSAGELLYQFADDVLRVPEQHPRAIREIELVVDAGKPGVLASFDGEHTPRLVGVDDRHAVYRGRLGRARPLG